MVIHKLEGMAESRMRNAIMLTTRALNLLIIVASIVAIAVLQDQIVTRMPKDTSSHLFQSWMTFFALVFLYLGVTEIYDESGLMLLRPKFYAEQKAKKQREAN